MSDAHSTLLVVPQGKVSLPTLPTRCWAPGSHSAKPRRRGLRDASPFAPSQCATVVMGIWRNEVERKIYYLHNPRLTTALVCVPNSNYSKEYSSCASVQTYRWRWIVNEFDHSLVDVQWNTHWNNTVCMQTKRITNVYISRLNESYKHTSRIYIRLNTVAIRIYGKSSCAVRIFQQSRKSCGFDRIRSSIISLKDFKFSIHLWKKPPQGVWIKRNLSMWSDEWNINL